MNVFNSKMALFDDSVEELCKCLNLTRPTLYGKLQGKSEFKQSEIKKIIIRYELTPEETFEIFFS